MTKNWQIIFTITASRHESDRRRDERREKDEKRERRDKDEKRDKDGKREKDEKREKEEKKIEEKRSASMEEGEIKTPQKDAGGKKILHVVYKDVKVY